MRLIKVFLGIVSMAVVLCWAWEERPGCEDHRDQDRRFRDAQSQTGAKEYEKDADRPVWQTEEGEDSNSSESHGEIGTYCRPQID